MSSPTNKPNSSKQKIKIACPNCHTKFQVSANLEGKQAKCCRCHNQMKIQAVRTNIPSPQTNGMISIKTKVGDSHRRGLESFRMGLNLKTFADISFYVSSLIFLPLFFMTGNTGFVDICQMLFSWFGIAAFIGLLICLKVPQQTQSRSFLVASLGCGIAGGALLKIMQWFATDQTLVTYLCISAALLLTCYFLHLFFLKKIAKSLKRNDVVKSLNQIIIIQASTTLLTGGMFLLPLAGLYQGDELVTFAIFAVLILAHLIFDIARVAMQLKLSGEVRKHKAAKTQVQPNAAKTLGVMGAV